MTSRSKKIRHSRSRKRLLKRPLLGVEALEVRRTMTNDVLFALQPDYLSVIQDRPGQMLNVLSNDSFGIDYNGQRKITAVSVGDRGGEVFVAADGRSLKYTPPPGFASQGTGSGNFNSTDVERFSYVVDGAHEQSVEVTVLPLLRDDALTFEVNEKDRVLNVLANDPFFDGYAGPKKITSISSTTNGGSVLMMDNDRAVLYSPATNFAGWEQFSYVVDGKYEAHVNIQIRTATFPDYFSDVRNGAEQTLDVLTNDCYVENHGGFGIANCLQIDVNRITAVTQPDHGGRVSIAADGRSLVYQSAGDFTGIETFSYTADGRYPAAVTINVGTPDDSFYFIQDATNETLDVLTNDLFRDGYTGARVITGVTQASGQVTIAEDGQTLLYSSPKNWLGTDTFEYTVDGTLTATVRVTTQRLLWDDWVQVIENSPGKTLRVLDNDNLGIDRVIVDLANNNFAGLDPVDRKITQVSSSQYGATVTIADDGESLLYKPAHGFHGLDHLTYTVGGRFTANVDVHVWQPFNDSWGYVKQFTADNLLDPMQLEIYYRDSQLADYTGARKLTAVGTPDHGGVVTITTNGTRLLYTPAPEFHGEETFSFTVDGEFTAQMTALVIPSVAPDTLNVQQNSRDNSLSVLLNDGFPDNYRGAKKITSLGPTKFGGTVSIDSNTSLLSYSPAKDFYGRDSFTYTVDGVQTTTVDVNVLRRLRDDQFHIAVGSPNNVLSVLVNDDFGSTYLGAKQITSAKTGAAHGTVAISGDRKSILYSPATGFAGTDTITYEVDGQFVATATVTVGNPRVLPSRTFATPSEMEAYLLAAGLTKFADQFGQETWPGSVYSGTVDYQRVDSSRVPASTLGPTNAMAGSANTSVEHSDTNVQVAGVDEGDIVETDGNFIYVLTGNELVIADSFPAADAHVVSRYKFSGQPTAQFLNGNLLTVISHTTAGNNIWPLALSRIAIDSFAPWWGPSGPRGVTVTVLDVTNRSAPQLVQETKLDGDYFDARAVGNFVHIVSKNNFDPPTPKTICHDYTDEDRAEYLRKNYPDGYLWGEPSFPEQSCKFESRESYEARASSFVNEMLPHYTTYDKDGLVVRSGLLIDATDIYGTGGTYSSNLFSLLTIDITSPDSGPVATTGLLTGSEGYVSQQPVLFASQDALYLFDAKSTNRPEDSVVTQIWKVQFDSITGRIQPVAAGQIPGTVLNQFSIDETDGLLRVATTNFSPTASRTENNVFVLRDDGGVFEYVGGVQDLAPTETIYSVRFFDDRAIVVTFRQIDPLFTIDLSDPTQPTVAGELKLPGFSTYIQPIDRDHVLTFGRGGPNGWDGPPQVSLFNIQDLQHPTLIDQVPVGSRGWSEDAWNDHHAVSYFSQYHVLAIPSNRTEYNYQNTDGKWYTEFHETFVFKIDVSSATRSDDGIQVLGQIAQDTTVRRNVRIEDALYSIADGNIAIVNVLDPTDRRGTVDLRPAPSETTSGDTPVATPTPHDALGTAIAAAQKSLATRLNQADPIGVLVTAERGTSSSIDEIFQVVLRVGDRQYLFDASANGESNAVEDDYSFSAIAAAAWHNAALPLDTNGDGFIAPDDALIIINQLNLTGARQLTQSSPVRAISAQASNRDRSQAHHWDIDNDGFIAPQDALRVINHLNRNQSGNREPVGEGEAPAGRTPSSLATDAWISTVKPERSSQTVTGVYPTVQDEQETGSANPASALRRSQFDRALQEVLDELRMP